MTATLQYARCGAPGSYEFKVRLDGIDALEKRHAFGERATQAMSDLVYMKDAALDCYKLDHYGSNVCKVSVSGQMLAWRW